ncbi:MAG: thioredoxin-dependent thiol peroxidase [Acidobacteriota bacterium]
MTELKPGDPAPDVDLLDERGEPFRLADLRGKRVVLYFYPRASTPGCTIEACEFRDASKKFAGRNAIIVGLSPDKPAAQQKFKTNRNLPFTLLADTEKAAAQAYGVWKQKSFMGKKFMGIERSTFVISEDGRIEKVFRKVKAAGHAAQVLEALA